MPDLVFSEMRFLQKPEPAGKEELECTSKKKHKKRRELSEDEISRYFDAGKTRPGNNERGREIPTTPLEASAAIRRSHTASPVVLNLPEKAFLGFGSRGTHPPTTSHCSWSDSGKASSSLAKQVVTTFEPLAVGQLQNGWAQNQTQAVSVEQNVTQHLSAKQTANKRHGGSHDRRPKSIPDTNRTTVRPARPQGCSGNDESAVSEIVFDKQKCGMPMPMPTAETLANYNEANANSISRTSSMGVVSADTRDNNRVDGSTSAYSRVLNQGGSRQYSKPWEELLQDCDVAARASIPIYHDNATPQHVRHISHEYANLQLWRHGGGNLSEYGYQDDTGVVSKRVCPGQPDLVDCTEGEDQSYGGMIDVDSKYLLEESPRDYDMLTEDEADWEEQGNAKRQNHIQEAEAMDEFATFWQPNKLY